MLLLNQLGQADVVSGLAVLETLLTSGNLLKRRSIGAWAWGLLAKCRDVGQMGSEEVGVLRDLGKKARGIFRGIMAGIEDEEGVEEEEDEMNDEDRQEGEDDEVVAECEDPGSNEFVTSNHEDSESSHSTENKPILDHNGTKNTEISPSLSSESSDPLAAARQRLLDSLKPSSPDAYGSKTTADQGTSYGIEEQKQHDTADKTDDEGDQQDTGDDDTGLMIRATLDMIITIVGEFYGQRDLLDGRLLWGEMPQGLVGK